MILLAFMASFIHSYNSLENAVDRILILELERRLYAHNPLYMNELSYVVQQRIAQLPQITNFSHGYSLQAYVQSVCNYMTSEQIQSLFMKNTQLYLQHYQTYNQFHALVAAKKNYKNEISQ